MFETLKKIRDEIKNVLGDSIKEYWLDDPSLIPFSALPALAIAPISTNIDIADTGRDIYTYTIDVMLIIDAKQELKKFKQEVIGVQYLTERMEAKDSTGALQENTILYIIRNNLTLGENWAISNVGDIDYSTRTRGVESGEQFVTKEAVLRIGVTRIKTR